LVSLINQPPLRKPIKKEALAMVYALHKLKHYLLGNRFVFYVNHMALVHLVNKPYISSKLVRWLLLFLEYDFQIVYNLGKSHLIVDALSNQRNKTKLVGIPNQTCDVHLFTLQLEWLHNVYEYLLEGDAEKIYYFTKIVFSLKS
jgi:hypothetical protein